MRRITRVRSSTARAARPPIEIVAPDDCTGTGALATLIGGVLDGLRSGAREIVLDLSHVRAMNSQLLSAIVYLARECARAGSRLRLQGISAQFEAWATTHGIMRHLRGRGLVGDVADSSTH